VNSAQTCGQCGAPLAPNAPDQLCVQCLINCALDQDAATIITDTPDSEKEVCACRRNLPSLALFGDHELLNELGRGGQGVVYRARQKSMNRLVALKCIPGNHLTSEDLIQRFRLEAEETERLTTHRSCRLIVGGGFTSFGGVPRRGLTRLRSDHAPRFVSAMTAANDGSRLSLNCLPGRTYLIERSEDLKAWLPWHTNQAACFLLNIEDTDRTRSLNPLYRALLS